MHRPAWKFALLSALATMTADFTVAARPAPVKDVSRQVEVVVGGRLRETTPGQGELSISLWNKTETAVAGPIYVVIEETGLADVKVGSHSEETATGKPVFELVAADKTLLPGGMTRSFPLAFSIPAGLSREEANKLDLVTRVYGRQGSPDAAKLARQKEAREDADFATRGKSYTQADLDAIRAFQREVSPQLLKKPDVIGTAITEDSKGGLALRVYTETRSAAKSLPGSMGNYTLDVQPVPGGFKTDPDYDSVITEGGKATSARTRQAQAAAGNARNGNRNQFVIDVDQTQRFDRPVPIGVSAFNAETADENGQVLCAAGTLGCRCIDSSGKIYALSNAHVFSDFGFAAMGQPIVQPSQGESPDCDPQTENNLIARIVDTTRYQNLDDASRFFNPNSLPMNFSDAALAEVVLSVDPEGNAVPAVGVSTPSDGYGTPSRRVQLQNRIGLQVQKYGRTTGYTRGITTAVDIYAPVGGDPDTTENFRLDEFVGMAGSFPFGDSGDSGSLIVTLEDRRPISLLFAGNGIRTLGNKIGPILDRFNVRVDDGTSKNVTTEGEGNSGLYGRGALAFGNISRQDLDTLITGGTDIDGLPVIIKQLLPPELRGRVKPNRRPLIPVNNGLFSPPTTAAEL